jgi:hypothetical protein
VGSGISGVELSGSANGALICDSSSISLHAIFGTVLHIPLLRIKRLLLYSSIILLHFVIIEENVSTHLKGPIILYQTKDIGTGIQRGLKLSSIFPFLASA